MLGNNLGVGIFRDCMRLLLIGECPAGVCREFCSQSVDRVLNARLYQPGELTHLRHLAAR